MMKLIIITPCKRLENIPYLFSNIRSNINEYIDVYWYPIFDKSEEEWFSFWKTKLEYLGSEYENFIITPILSSVSNANAGHAHRNIVLELIKDKHKRDWVYNLDDDNILYPNFIPYLTENEKKLKRKRGVIFSQIWKNDKMRLDVNKIEVCHVDMAMLLFKPKYLKGLRFDENDYCADGYFIQSFYEQNKKRMYLESKPLCYYNYLK